MSIARHHTEWLSLVPVSGPFLSLPVLMQAFSAGLEVHDADHFRLLRQEYANWQDALEKRKGNPAPHNQWIRFVLNQTLDLDDQVLAEGQSIPQTLHVEFPEHREMLRPNIIVNDPTTKKTRLLIQTYPRSQNLNSYVANSPWKASPDTRMMELLHATGVRLGLITNGEHWMLVDAPKGETTGYSSWYASGWFDETITLQAFRSLLSAGRFFNVPDDQTLEALLTQSASNQQEVTDQLGYQVRRAVEVLIHSLDRADQDYGRELLADVLPAQLYESALTVMMRLVFLFCAEERELIPSKPFPVYEQNYSVSTISKQLRELADQHGEELLERRYDAWPRLLAAFRSVYGGLKHDEVHIPAYGGNLFNPDRFPFLEGRMQGTSWADTQANPLPVNNRTVLHLLEALQLLQIKVPGGGPAEARRLSFQALDIEQIGHVYEGLLDHTAKRANEPFLGLVGKRNQEPEIPLAELEKLHAKGEDDLFKFLKKETGKTVKALQKLLNVELDAQEASRFRTACQGDEALWHRIEPFAGMIRLDNFGYPVVITKGSIFVTAGTDRRSSGTHYTPRSLTEPIVQYTMEPLVYVGPAEGKPKGEWKLKSAKELLDLKICDMACGSGAFLVQTARYMADRVLEAWDEAKKANPQSPGITPEGLASSGKVNESLIPDDPHERKTYAMRIIAQRCLYGVDKNPLAVEMAKLSLWLLTLAKDKPFEFLDHSIRCGDSLVGLHDIKQLKTYSLDCKGLQLLFNKVPLDEYVDEAINLRLKIEDMPTNSVDDVKRQEKLLTEANEKIARLRCAADLLVAGEFWGENAKDKLERVRHAAVKSGYYVEKGPTDEFEQVAANDRRGQLMFHWPLEFPEVIVKRGGFDAFVGNPPFMGGSKIATEYGVPYRDHLVDVIAEERRGQRGQADLCSYFFCRLAMLVRLHGSFGVLATNTISQGDTRVAGLDHLTASGLVIYRAIATQRWPGTANLEVASVWTRRGIWAGTSLLDEKEVESITSLLTPSGQITGTPHRLKRNGNLSFEGSRIEGTGFVLSPEQASSLIASNPINGEVLCRFLRGEDFLNRPDQSPAFFVINFRTWPLNHGSAPSGYIGPVAADFPDCLSIVERDVKPQRMALPPTIAINITTAANWWRYRDVCPALHAALEETRVERVLFHPFTSKHVAFAFVKCDCVFAAPHNVFVFDDWGHFSVLQSSYHIEWAYTYCSTLETRLRYTRSSIFETFAFPNGLQALDSVGQQYHDARAALMLQRNEGLTKTYNRFHDSDESSADIQKLRDLHVEMDQAVAAAYGWTDLDLGHGFHETKQGVRFTISEPARREVLQRLLKLNHERYAEEVEQGLHSKAKSRKTKAAKKKKAIAKPVAAIPSLFDMDDDVSFPSTELDHFLCALLSDLVAAEPGLQDSAYIDALVIAVGHKKHNNLLTGDDRAHFNEFCKAIPKTSKSDSTQIPWSDLKNVLSRRHAIKPSSDSLQPDSKWHEVRKSYSAISADLVAIIRKAASALRDLQAQAQESNTIKEFDESRQQLCGEIS